MRTAAIALLLIAACSMAEELQYAVHWRAYLDALADEDYDAAAESSYAAWQSAERELGDTDVTAALAYLYGRQVIFDDVENAYPALRRARRLSHAGKSNLYENDLNLYYAYADLMSGNFQLAEIYAFQRAMAEMEEPEVASEMSVFWPIPSNNEFPVHAVARRLRNASAIYERTAGRVPVEERDIAMALLFRGAARIVLPTHSGRDLVEAQHDLMLSCSLLPRPDTAARYDPLMAQNLAWQLVARAAAYRINRIDLLDRDTDPKMAGVVCKWTTKILDSDFAAGCQYRQWSLEPAWLPRGLGSAGRYGAVVFVYQLSEDLDILRPRILAEAPTKRYGDAMLDFLIGNRIDTDDADDRCRRDVIDWRYYR